MTFQYLGFRLLHQTVDFFSSSSCIVVIIEMAVNYLRITDGNVTRVQQDMCKLHTNRKFVSTLMSIQEVNGF